MCYRCGFCAAIVPPGQSRRVYHEHRLKPRISFTTIVEYDFHGKPIHRLEQQSVDRREIAREIHVCASCSRLLTVEGLNACQLRERLVRDRQTRARQAEVLLAPARKDRRRLAQPILSEEELV